MLEVYVSGLAFDTLSKAPVVLLKEIDGQRVLPIWIGPNEAAVIALELSGVSSKRPLTHDLLKSVMNGFNAKLQKIVVSSLKENTYFEKIYMRANENSIIQIDIFRRGRNNANCVQKPFNTLSQIRYIRE